VGAFRVEPPRGGLDARLEFWSIRQTASGEQFLVGLDAERGHGWVSATIAELDARTRVAKITNGQSCVLSGAGGYSPDAEHVWNGLAREMRVPGWRDVTPELCPDWRNPVPEAERQPASSASVFQRSDRRAR
jgi:hypothetical protein